jgi:hypothetical protein
MPYQAAKRFTPTGIDFASYKFAKLIAFMNPVIVF